MLLPTPTALDTEGYQNKLGIFFYILSGKKKTFAKKTILGII